MLDEKDATPLLWTEDGKALNEFHFSYDSAETVSIKKSDRKIKKSYFWPCALFMIYSLSFSMVIPAIPGLVLELVDNNNSLASFYFGSAAFVRYTLEFISSPLLGNIADERGRKQVIMLSFSVCAIEFFLLALIPSIFMVYIARILSGLGDVGTTTTYTIITDIATHNGENVTQKYGLIGAMFGLAFIIGPFTGGMLCTISFRLCLLIASAIATLATVLAYIFLEESLALVSGNSVRSHNYETVISCNSLYRACSYSFASLKAHMSNRNLCNLTIPLILSTLGNGYYFSWYMFMDSQYHASASKIGLYLSFVGVISAVVQGLLIHRMIPSLFSELRAAIIGLLLMAVHVFLIGFCSTMKGLYILSLLFCLQSMYYPALKALIIKESFKQVGAEKCQGNLQGVIGSIKTLSTAVSSLIFSALFAYSLKIQPHPMVYLTFIASSVLFLVAAVYLYYVTSGKGNDIIGGNSDDEQENDENDIGITTANNNTLYFNDRGGSSSSVKRISGSLSYDPVSNVNNNNNGSVHSNANGISNAVVASV